MIVTAVRYAFTRNLGNYESAKLEIEAIPNEGGGQTAEQVLAEVKAYVMGNLPGPLNGAVDAPPAKPEKKTGNSRTKKADKLKAPADIEGAFAAITSMTDGNSLAVLFNACRDSELAGATRWPDVCKAVAEKCQALCDIGTPERAAIGAALKAEKLKRE